MGFGSRLRDARNAKSLSGEAVGRKLGVTKATVSKWEAEIHDPSVQQTRDLCVLLDVSPDWLYEWSKDQMPAEAMAEARAYAQLSPEDRRKWRALRRTMFSTTE